MSFLAKSNGILAYEFVTEPSPPILRYGRVRLKRVDLIKGLKWRGENYLLVATSFTRDLDALKGRSSLTATRRCLMPEQSGGETGEKPKTILMCNATIIIMHGTMICTAYRSQRLPKIANNGINLVFN